MAYLPLNNYNYDSGYRRIQSGPNHEQFIVLTSGSSAYGADNGIVVAGSPLSGTLAAGAWDYDDNWRYVPSTLPTQSGSLDPTPYNVSGALDTYDGTRIATRTSVAGAQAASAIGSDFGVVQPRGGALQPGADVTRPEKYMYFGGAAPDNQNYSPYNTPDANTAAEGKTGGPVTHRTYENTLITNVLGSQGTSDRSQWRYHQPVYCKTFTETVRSDSPGLMSTPLRYVYRGSATQYNYLYGSLFGGSANASSPTGASFGPGNPGGFKQLPYDDQTGGCGIPVGCPTTNGFSSYPVPGDVLTAYSACVYTIIRWYNTSSTESIGEGSSYIIQDSDINTQIYFEVTYPDASTDLSSSSCFPLVGSVIANNFFLLYSPKWYASLQPYNIHCMDPSFDNFGAGYIDTWWEGGGGSIPLADPYIPVMAKVDKDRNIVWSYSYKINDGFYQYIYDTQSHCLVDNSIYSFFFRKESNTSSSYIRLYQLTLFKDTGAIQAIKGVRLFAASFNFDYTVDNAVKAVKTDGSGTFWLLCEVSEDFVSSPLRIRQVHTLVCLTTLGDGSLNLAWTYEILKTRIPGSGYRDAGSNYFKLDLTNGLIYINTYNTYVPTTVLNAYTGGVISRSDYIAENSSPTSVLSTTEVAFDGNGNTYRAEFSDSPANYLDLYNYPSAKLWISKRNSTGSIVWMKNFTQAVYSGTSTALNYIISNGSFLIIQDILVVLVTRQGSLPTYQWALLMLIDPNNGAVLRYVQIQPPSTNSTFGSDLRLIQSGKPDEFVLFCSYAYHLTLNINEIPVNTTISTISPSGYFYTFTDIVPSGTTNYTGVSAAGYSLPPIRTWPVTANSFTLPTASGELTTPASATVCTNIAYT